MNNVDKLLIKNDLPENEYEKFRIYSEVFIMCRYNNFTCI